jgi:hypothetical protein
MSVGNTKVQSVLEATFLEAINKLEADEAKGVVSDLFVQADAESGELQLYDEHEVLLGKVIIFDWVNSNEESFDREVAESAKAALTSLAAKNVFDNPRLLKPFAVSLVDEEFTVIEELLFIDDDMLRLDDPLLKNLDEELDKFINELLSDTPK